MERHEVSKQGVGIAGQSRNMGVNDVALDVLRHRNPVAKGPKSIEVTKVEEEGVRFVQREFI